MCPRDRSCRSTQVAVEIHVLGVPGIFVEYESQSSAPTKSLFLQVPVWEFLNKPTW